MNNNKALVLFSGGQDSATCLGWALESFEYVETLGFDYGQRHKIELEQRDVLRREMRTLKPEWNARLADDHTLDLGILGQVSQSALTQEMAIAMQEDGLPNTFVPGRNLIFLTFAATLAYRRGLRHIVGGMCETDFSGYPDCRDDAMKAMQVALNTGMASDFVLHTPLMWRDKAATWCLTEELGGKALVDVVIEHSHTCYEGNREKRHIWGFGCGKCPSCQLRAAGFQAYKAL